MSPGKTGDETGVSTWWARNAGDLSLVARVAFGLVWLVDGLMKFVWLAPSDVVTIVQTSGQGQPAWLAPWFNFWGELVSSNPAFMLYGVGSWELILGFMLVFGFMRKLSYLSGVLLSLMIWSIDEGFGGPYGPGSTDIGAAVIYVFVYLSLIALESSGASSRLTLDSLIEKRNKGWRRISEFAGPAA